VNSPLRFLENKKNGNRPLKILEISEKPSGISGEGGKLGNGWFSEPVGDWIPIGFFTEKNFPNQKVIWLGDNSV
jgi:hypothetical protein